MGSFKSPARKAEDGIVTVHGPAAGLSEGEWVRYWEVFPHSLQAALTSEATTAKVEMGTRQVVATFDPGLAVLARLRLGIVDWSLLDEDGEPVPWDPSKSAALIDGLSDETFNWLSEHIGEPTRKPTPLAAPADPEVPRSESQGEG